MNMALMKRKRLGNHKPRDQFFHTNWTGTGGNVSSSIYKV